MRLTVPTLIVSVVTLLGAVVPAYGATAETKFAGTYDIPPEPKGGSPGHTVSVYSLFFTAAAGEVNDLTAGSAPGIGAIRLADAGATITPGFGCQADGAGVICTGVNGALKYALGDGDDRATINQLVNGEVDAGEGNDTLRFVQSGGSASLGPGDDSLVGEYPSGRVSAGLWVAGGSGADSISGTLARSVTASYTDRTAGIDASLDGVANDGEPGEGDQLGSGVGAVVGGAGPDTLTGGATTDDLKGGPGDDVISGGGDKDLLNGGEGNDTLHGDEGDEDFQAEPGADTVRGGAGFDSMRFDLREDAGGVTVTLDDKPGDGLAGENDDIGTDVELLLGGKGDDRLTGSDGPDVLKAVGGSDFVDGRGGADTLFGNTASLLTGGGRSQLVGGSGVDSFKDVGTLADVLAVDGEADKIECADRGIAPIMGDLSDTGTGCLFGFDVPSPKSRLKVDRGGNLRLPAYCVDIGVTCTGTVVLVAPDAKTRRITGRVLARGKLKVSNDRPHSVRLRLSSRARNALARRRSIFVRASFATTRELPAESRVRTDPVRLVAARR